MDSLTHLAVAGTLAVGARGRGLGVRGAILLAGSAVIPDAVEQVFRPFGAAIYLRLYHGPFHSLLVTALLAAGLAVVARGWNPHPLFPVLAGFGSHLLLDLFHGYGVELFWPLSDRRFGLPLMANYDLPVLSILGLAILGPALLNLVNREIGASRVSGMRAAWVALALVAVLLPARWFFRSQSSSAIHAAPLTEGPESLAVFPSPLLPWRWTAVEDTSIAYLIYEMDGWTGQRRPYLVRLPKPLPNNLLVGARDSSTGRAFLEMATYPYYSLQEGRQAVLVRIRDLAFYSPGGSDRPFSVEVEVTSTMKVLSEKAVF